MNKTRLEAFSDGVIAIIITIMVLELKVPEHHEWSDLFKLLPIFLSYILSFIYVGIYWINHHHLLATVHKVSAGVLWSNLNLLFWLSLFPFASAWAGESHFAPQPMTIYAFVAFMSGLSYLFLYKAIIKANPYSLLKEDTNNSSEKKNLISLIACFLGIITPFFGHIGVIICSINLIGVSLMWFIPDRRIEQVLQDKPTLN